MIRDRIVFGVRDVQQKERLLRISADLTLEKTITACRAVETSQSQIKSMSASQSVKVNAINTYRAKGGNKYGKKFKSKPVGSSPVNNTSQPYQRNTSQSCQRCGERHGPRQCKAYGKTCHMCHRKNHFAKMCKSKTPQTSVKSVDILEESDDNVDGFDELFIGSVFIGGVNCNDSVNKWCSNIEVNGTVVNFKLDTGAHANIIPIDTYKTLSDVSPLKKTNTVLSAFGDFKITPVGVTTLQCSAGECQGAFKFYVTDVSATPLLGQDACEALSLIKRVQMIDNVPVAKPISMKTLTDKYNDVFTGVGQFDGEYHIEIDKTVKPVIHARRKVPFTQQAPLKKKLDAMVKDNFIARVEKPTPWVNSLVITDKRDGSLRICLDPTDLNEAILREHHPIPTPEDVASRLCGKKIFTILDEKDGYWQVKLDDESSYLTTFNTPGDVTNS